MSVIMTANLALKFDIEKTVEGIPGKFSPSFANSFKQESGTIVNTQDRCWYDNDRQLTASSTETIDVAGALSDPYGDTITCVRLKGLYVKNKNTAVGDVLQLFGGSNPMLFNTTGAEKWNLGPGAIFFWSDPSAAGRAVTAGTGDLLLLAEIGTANTLTFDIAFWGASA